MNKIKKHTILGAGGSIGNALTFELLKQNQKVRLVSRTKHTIPRTEYYRADITNYKETLESIKGTDIVYLCVGLPYDAKIWKTLWEKIIRNVINACKSVGARLVFFDNVYMYGKVNGKMTENTLYIPCSKKGEIRAKISEILEREIHLKNIDAIIARSADLYGPFATKNSLPYLLVFNKLLNGKKPQWIVNSKALHSYSFTIDCAKGLALLSNKDECYNQIWHLPTYSPAINGETFIKLTAQQLNAPANYMLLKKWMIKMISPFNKPACESLEMLYQNEYDYYFDSTKFNNYFNYQPTSYTEGIKTTIESLTQNYY